MREDRIIRTVVGLRPFRSAGFRVEPERVGDTTIVHHYGHGGAGVTLSWGTASLAADYALATGERTFAVVGCGAVGLATARTLQQRGGEVTIYARDLPPDTTSNVAGAQWAPFTVVDPEYRAGIRDQLELASRIAFRTFQDLVGEAYGVYWRRNFLALHEPSDLAWEMAQIADLFPEHRVLAAGEHPFPRPHVRQFTTMHIEPARYLRAVLRDFHQAGGRVVVRTFDSLQDLAELPSPVVMNCSGLGAARLANDDLMIPIKGQLTALLPQPEVDYVTIAEGIYMMPRSDGIMLGGTHERGVDTLDPNPTATRRILEGHRAFFDAMSP